VHAHGVDIGAVEEGFVGAGIVGPNAVDEFVLPQEPAAFGLRIRLDGRRRRGSGRWQVDRDGGERRLGGYLMDALEAQ